MILLSIDLGLKAGLAWFQDDGQLIRCRSANFPNMGTLKKAIPVILDEIKPLTHLVIEGGGTIAKHWINAAEKRSLAIMQTTAETWREQLLWQRERRTGLQAKQYALNLAYRLLKANNLRSATPISDDTAEAVLCGIWALNQLNIIKLNREEIARL
ncbi:MAG: hypothetical protein GX561_08160 [Lentisphaerae bacterium]|jgi:hypothetical protein|nr:hypothetical protein [Lentisphaerota bacterium]